MESATVTILRTGAATAVATRHLARRGASVATICGAGTQGAIQLRALQRVLPLTKVFAWSRDAARASAFAEKMSAELKLEIVAARELAPATLASDIVVTCTPAKQWFLGRAHVKPGAFVAAVGSSTKTARELDDALLARAAHVVVEWQEAAHQEAGDLVLAAPGVVTPERLVELGEFIVNPRPRAPQDIVVYKSVGIGLEDVALARLVAHRLGVC